MLSGLLNPKPDGEDSPRGDDSRGDSRKRTSEEESHEPRRVADDGPIDHRTGMRKKACARKGCERFARIRSKYCAAHGGGPLCQQEGCPKAARPSSRFCGAHGGGKRCATDGCSRLAQGSTAYCVSHGGGCRCAYEGCTRGSRGMSGLCRKHTRISNMAKETSEAMMRISRRDHQDQRWESYHGNFNLLYGQQPGMPLSFGAAHQSAGSEGMYQSPEGAGRNGSDVVPRLGVHQSSLASSDTPLLLLPARNQTGDGSQRTAMYAVPVPLSQEAVALLSSLQGINRPVGNASSTAASSTYAPASNHSTNSHGGGRPLLPSCTELLHNELLPLFSTRSSTAPASTAPPSRSSATTPPSAWSPSISAAVEESDLQLGGHMRACGMGIGAADQPALRQLAPQEPTHNLANNALLNEQAGTAKAAAHAVAAKDSGDGSDLRYIYSYPQPRQLHFCFVQSMLILTPQSLLRHLTQTSFNKKTTSSTTRLLHTTLCPDSHV